MTRSAPCPRTGRRGPRRMRAERSRRSWKGAVRSSECPPCSTPWRTRRASTTRLLSPTTASRAGLRGHQHRRGRVPREHGRHRGHSREHLQIAAVPPSPSASSVPRYKLADFRNGKGHTSPSEVSRHGGQPQTHGRGNRKGHPRRARRWPCFRSSHEGYFFAVTRHVLLWGCRPGRPRR